MTIRDRGALAAVAAGVAALSMAGVVACAAQPADDVGAEQARRLATASAPAEPVAPVPTAAGALPTTDERVPPVRLRIPDIDVTATVNPVGINQRTNEFDVPPSVDEVGWYRFGPGVEAATGSVVIAGHVDSSSQGKGAFFRLRELTTDDRMSVTGADGRQREFRVVAREEYDKSKIPLERYFARDGSMRLTLITCGGPFDAETRRYRDNIVITAVPV